MNGHNILQYYMNIALLEATIAYDKGDIPVGAVITDNNYNIISQHHNLVQANCDPTAHAELLALRDAADKTQSLYMHDMQLFTTLEPCAMCAMACAHAKIGRIIFGAYDSKSGGIEQGAAIFNHKQTHHKPDIIGGVLESECQQLLKSFFYDKRH